MARRSLTRTTRGGLAALAGGVVLLVTAALVQPALAAVPSVPYDDNETCADFGFTSSFKIDRQPTNGDYTVLTPQVQTVGSMPAGLVITISNVVVDTTAKTVTFDWSTAKSASTVNIQTVLVKFADGGLRYSYGGAGATHDEGLIATKDSISHVDFCWGVTEETTTTTSSTTTTTTGETTTTTEAPTTTTTAAPTTTTTEGGTTTTERATTTTDGVTTTTTEGGTTTTEEVTTTTAEGATTTQQALPTSIEQATTTTVMGTQIERLPRTGLAALPLLQMGLGLIGLGIVLLAYDRREALGSS